MERTTRFGSPATEASGAWSWPSWAGLGRPARSVDITPIAAIARVMTAGLFIPMPPSSVLTARPEARHQRLTTQPGSADQTRASILEGSGGIHEVAPYAQQSLAQRQVVFEWNPPAAIRVFREPKIGGSSPNDTGQQAATLLCPRQRCTRRCDLLSNVQVQSEPFGSSLLQFQGSLTDSHLVALSHRQGNAGPNANHRVSVQNRSGDGTATHRSGADIGPVSARRHSESRIDAAEPACELETAERQ